MVSNWEPHEFPSNRSRHSELEFNYLAILSKPAHRSVVSIHDVGPGQAMVECYLVINSHAIQAVLRVNTLEAGRSCHMSRNSKAITARQ